MDIANKVGLGKQYFLSAYCVLDPLWVLHILKPLLENSLVVQWLRLHTPNSESLGSIPFRELGPARRKLRVCMSQLKIPHTATKTCAVKQTKKGFKNCFCYSQHPSEMGHYYEPHFTNEETETRGGIMTYPTSSGSIQ